MLLNIKHCICWQRLRQTIDEIQLLLILLSTHNCCCLRLHVKWEIYKLLAIISLLKIFLSLRISKIEYQLIHCVFIALIIYI